MKKIVIEINTENAAFDGPAFDGDDNPGREIARILLNLSLRIGGGEYPDELRDINGNKVGTVSVFDE